MLLKDLELKFKHNQNFKKIFSNKDKYKKEFQRLEFLGDKVIAIIVANELYNKFKEFDEGRLSKVFSFLTSAITLEKIAKDIELDSLLIRKKNTNISRKVLSDFLEAIIGSLFVDRGFSYTKSIVLSLWKKEITNNKDLKGDIKSILQEWTQAKNLGLPDYKIVAKSGPDHKPLFQVRIIVKSYNSILGKGKSLQEAQKEAARLFANKHLKENLID